MESRKQNLTPATKKDGHYIAPQRISMLATIIYSIAVTLVHPEVYNGSKALGR